MTRLSKLFIVTVVCAVLLDGCATTKQKVSFYTLQSIGVSPANRLPAATRPLAIIVGPAEFPRYLQRSQIVTRSDETRLTLADYHRWGGSFEESVLTTLGENLATLLGTRRMVVYPTVASFPIDYRITLDIVQFEGSLGKQVVLKARWTIIDSASRLALAVEQSHITQAVTNGSYGALVVAHSDALASLSVEITNKLLELPLKGGT